MSILWRVLFSFVALCEVPFIRCAADDHSEAIRLGDQYLLDAEFVLDNGYFVVAVIDVEASANSDLLFKSRVRTELFQSKSLRYEFVETNPTIIADDRKIEDKQFEGPMGSSLEKWKRLYLSSGTYEMLGVYGDSLVVPSKISEKSFSLRFGSTVVNPFDWPLLSFRSFDKTGERNLAKYVFGEDRECIYAKSNGGVLDTHWVKKGQDKSITRVCFRDEHPVLKEVFVFAQGRKPNNYKLTDGVLILRTETEWEPHNNTAEFFPKRVVSTQFKGLTSSYTRYTGNIRIYDAEHDDFKSKSKDLEDIAKNIVVVPQVKKDSIP